jgi:hypothetical protein
MADRIRFSEARQVFEAFPSACRRIEPKPGEERPIEYLRRLAAAARRFEAVAFAACLLPRREAVWWGCQCLRALNRAEADRGLAAAEAWVRDPEDETRRAALAVGAPADPRGPGDWLALAAGQSGGDVAIDGLPPRPAPPEATAVAVKCAVVLAIAQRPAGEQKAWTAACVEAAIRFAEGGEAKVRAPTPPSVPAGRAQRR